MKKFLLYLAACGSLVIAILFAIVALRMARVSDDVTRAATVRENTEVLVIGNSHAGCTWEDDSAQGVQVMWRSACTLPFYWVKLEEAIRCGGLRNVKTLVVVCDRASIGLKEERLVADAAEMWPITWRYLHKLPVSSFAVVKKMLLPLSAKWNFIEVAPTDDRCWTKLSSEQRAEELNDIYGKPLPPPSEEVQRTVLDYLGRMKAICDNHGVKIVLYFSPLPSDNPQRGDEFLPVWKSRLESVGYRVIDYRTSMPDDRFRDSHHLSYRGRLQFTKEHVKDVK